MQAIGLCVVYVKYRTVKIRINIKEKLFSVRKSLVFLFLAHVFVLRTSWFNSTVSREQ